LFEKQHEWASHGSPNMPRAWEIAGEAGVDLAKARQDATQPDIEAILTQDMADVRTVQIQGTPTFYVNGKQPAAFGPEPLAQLVQSEVAAAK
jgi:protein-disulfide isomerase